MPESIAIAIAGAIQLYLAAGVGVAAWLLWRGLERLDPQAAGATRGFRAIVFPGLVALWPVLLIRALRGTPPGAERSAHRDRAAAPEKSGSERPT